MSEGIQLPVVAGRRIRTSNKGLYEVSNTGKIRKVEVTEERLRDAFARWLMHWIPIQERETEFENFKKELGL